MMLRAVAHAPPPVPAAGTRVSADEKQEQFRSIVLPHLADALAFARYLTGSRDDAEDLVQEACIRAFAGIATYAGGNTRAWLLAIVRNASFTWLAKHRTKSLVLGDEADIAEMGEEEPSPTPEAQLIAKAETEAVTAAVAALPGPYREVVILRDINGCSYRQIATMIGIPLGTVMSRLARA